METMFVREGESFLGEGKFCSQIDLLSIETNVHDKSKGFMLTNTCYNVNMYFLCVSVVVLYLPKSCKKFDLFLSV